MDNFDEKPFGALLGALKKNQHKFLNDRLKKVDLTAMQAVFLIKIHYLHKPKQSYYFLQNLVNE